MRNGRACSSPVTTEPGKKVDMALDHPIPRCDQEVITAGELVVRGWLMTVDGKETLIGVSWLKKSGVYTLVMESKFRTELELERTRAHFEKKKAFQKILTRGLHGN
jgi:hypothetical protein